MIFADILLKDTAGNVFTYHLENTKKFTIEQLTGRYVNVPLRKQKNCLGLIVRIWPDGEKPEFKTKGAVLIDTEFFVDKTAFQLAEEVEKHSFCDYHCALELFMHKSPADEYIPRIVETVHLADSSLVKDSETARKRVVDYLLEFGPAERINLQNATNQVKSGILQMVKKGIISIKEQREDQVQQPAVKEIEPLSDQQQRAYQEFIDSDHREMLLYGVTGSGKTQVYLKLIERAIKEGRRALFLLPEIALTPQMASRITDVFGRDRVAVIHSMIPPNLRAQYFKKINDGEIDVVLGARSAVFAPLRNIGMIVIDEFHENSFVSGKYPRYCAIEIAKALAKLEDARILMGSATPSVDVFYEYLKKGAVIEMPNRYMDFAIPRPSIIDLRHESNKTIGSMLKFAIEDRLAKREQTILFMNRKGYSVLCRCTDCGGELDCPACEIAYTYYRKSNELGCSYCGRRERAPKVCPKCGADSMEYYGIGTEKLETIVKEEFPTARVARIDRSVVTSMGRLESILESFKAREIDILIGTQLVAKGLDFPHVTLVGIVSADIGLRIPTYMASERAFQSFTQVAGRAGRAGLESQVVLQTYDPAHYAVSTSDFRQFYEKELEFRSKLGYPPFRKMISLIFSDKDYVFAQETASRARDYIRRRIKKDQKGGSIVVLPVVVAGIKKIDYEYRFQVLVLSSPDEYDAASEYVSATRKNVEQHKLASLDIDIGG